MRITLMLGLCLGCLLTTPVTAAEFTLESCEIQGLSADARCGKYSVYENRDAASGRQIPLHVVVLPATGDNPKPDPVIFFAGGPGASSVNMAAGVATFHADDLQQRDFVFIDYRGTGQSQALRCPYQQHPDLAAALALEHFVPLEHVDECRAELAKNTDLSQYTTPIITDDIAEVLQALGYRQVNLWGGSYGTRVALVMMQRHPELVRTATLEGVAPTDAKTPFSFAADAQAALDSWFAACAAEPACAEAFSDPSQDLAKIMAELEQEPKLITVANPQTQSNAEIRLTPNAFAQTLRYMLYTPPQALNIPAFLNAAANGNWQPLGQSAFNIGYFLLGQLPMGLYLSVSCTEDVAQIPADTAGDQSGFLGDLRVRQELGACSKWTKGNLPDNFYTPEPSDIPVLLLSGERDPVTPQRWANHVQRFLTNSLNLEVPESAHSDMGLKNTECIRQMQSELLATASLENIKHASCLAGISRPGFVLEIPSDTRIAMSREQLKRFSGTYSMQNGGFQLVLELAEDGLMAIADGNSMQLTPIGPMRLKVAGAPAGDHFDFIEENGEIVGIDVVRSGASQLQLQKQSSAD